MRWKFLGALLRTGRPLLVPRAPHKSAAARSFPSFVSSTLTSSGVWRLVLLVARARGTVRAGFRGGVRPRKFGSGGSDGRPSTFRLSAGITTLHLKTAVGIILLALAHPLDGPQPDDEYDSSGRAALQESGKANDVGPMRRAFFTRTQRWLEYYFAGEVEDPGETLGDIIREYGVYLPAADSRILRIFPPGKSKSDRDGEDGRDGDHDVDGGEKGPLPVVQVAIHFCYRYPPVMTGDSASAAAFNTAEGIKENIMTATFKHIRRWNDPRFDRCLVWVITADTDDFYYLDWPEKAFEQLPFWSAGIRHDESSNAIALV